MSTEENKALVRRIAEAFNGNLDVVDETFATDCIFDGAPADVQGAEGAKKVLTWLHSVFPDFHLTYEDMVAEGDKVWVRSRGYGTHQGEYHGIAPTGKQVMLLGLRTYRIAGGKVVEHWGLSNELSVLQQLGAVLSMQA